MLKIEEANLDLYLLNKKIEYIFLDKPIEIEILVTYID